MWAKSVDWNQLAKSRVMDSCDYCDEISDFIKGKEVLERLCSTESDN
jgi:hypothetical protein